MTGHHNADGEGEVEVPEHFGFGEVGVYGGDGCGGRVVAGLTFAFGVAWRSRGVVLFGGAPACRGVGRGLLVPFGTVQTAAMLDGFEPFGSPGFAHGGVCPRLLGLVAFRVGRDPRARVAKNALVRGVTALAAVAAWVRISRFGSRLCGPGVPMTVAITP